MSKYPHIKLLTIAVEHYQAYLLIIEHNHSITDKFHVKYYLICRSIELLLKSWLVYCGISEVELKSRYGHNLKKLIVESIHQNIESKLEIIISQEIIDTVDKLNTYYKPKDFEYPVTGFKSVPLYIQLNKPLEDIISKLERFYRHQATG